LGKVTGSTGVESLAKVRKSPNFDPGELGEV
jgi:hypothetical protein